MANELDELTGPTAGLGNDINVINKQLPVTIGLESIIFEIVLWVALPIIFFLLGSVGQLPQGSTLYFMIGGLFPGVVFVFMKINALAYLRQLQQKIQADASQIDSFLEQRVIILTNVVGLLDKAIDLDKDVMKTVTAYRSRISPSVDVDRNTTSQKLDGVLSQINIAFEAYPELQAHGAIADAMAQNSYLQKEITAARTLYNDTLVQWNRDIFAWPTKQIVAARNNYTTRIPFIATTDVKSAARSKFF